ncbi:hypothetical protein MKX53_06770 [Psychrobacillus sp. FSL K6-4615]|uniref:hypothetical protein n=1 Tax=Psychrobacillus sp. FSL K6-4615 TaxID=2921551 RepID=UPI0030F654C4
MDKVKKDMENKLAYAIKLFEQTQIKRVENREVSKQNYSLLLDAHLSATACIGSLLYKNNLRLGKSNESISGRLSLIASFVQGIDLCETSISEGLYAQAANLLKQELETIAALEEFIAGNRKDGKTPNVKFVKWDMAKIYGDLNKVAHVSDRKSFDPLFQIGSLGDAYPVSMLPIYNKEISRELYAYHVAFIIQIANHLILLHNELYEEEATTTEYLMLAGAIKRLEDEGYLKDIN